MGTETLRPNAVGDVTQCGLYDSANWQAVCDVSSDGDATYVWSDAGGYDLYNLPNHTTGNGTINHVKVYAHCKYYPTSGCYVRTKIKTGGTEYQGDLTALTAAYAYYSTQYNINPKTGVAWTWDDIDALQIGVYLIGDEEVTAGWCTQVYVEIDYTPGVALTVTTQDVSSIETTSCIGNGNITDVGGQNCTRRGFCYKAGTSGDPTTADSVVYDDGIFSEGAYTKAITGLSPGTSYRVRAYAINPTGTVYGATVQMITLPLAPTGVVASKGEHSDKVKIDWTKSTGASGYRVYRDEVDASGLLGDVDTFDDTGADAPVITPGDALASDGKHSSYVRLSLSSVSIADGTTHTYKVVAINASGNSADSNTDTGWCCGGALTYQWQRSAADSDASYSNISGAIYTPYNDTGAPAYPGGGRYYKCVINAVGSVEVTSTADRGYRKSALKPGNVPTIIIKNPDGEMLAYAPFASVIGYDYRVNELGSLKFNLPGGDPARSYIVYPNEAWLYIDGELKDIFKIIQVEKAR